MNYAESIIKRSEDKRISPDAEQHCISIVAHYYPPRTENELQGVFKDKFHEIAFNKRQPTHYIYTFKDMSKLGISQNCMGINVWIES